MRSLQVLLPVITVLLWSGFAASAYAQQEPAGMIQDVQTAYRQLEYEKAEQLARRALTEYQRFNVDQLTEIHRLLGLIEISQNDRAAGRRHFEAALSLAPQLELDPTFVSPKIIDFFNGVKRDYLTASGVSARDSMSVRYYLVVDSRSEAVLRSALVPGWGQLYKGESTKGGLLLGSWSLSLGGAAVTEVLRQRGSGGARTLRGVRNGLLLTAAGSWLTSYLDALLSPPRSRPVRERVSLQLRSTGPLHLALRIEL